MKTTVASFALLSLLLHQTYAGTVLTAGSTSIDVETNEYLDLVNGSNRTVTVRCATYLTSHQDDHKFDKACFTTVFTDGNTFFECEAKFGDKACNYCKVCQTPDQKVGYHLDCFNVQPAENTLGCDELTDMNVQQLLVDEEFSAMNSIFNTTVESENPESGAPAKTIAAITIFMYVLSMFNV